MTTCSNCTALEARIAELTRQRDAALESWRCFHCGFETADRKEAAGHFGDCDEVQPLCLIWSELSDHERLAECQNVSGQLAEEREENSKLRAQIEDLEYRVEGQLSEIHSFAPFRKCDSIQQVFHVYDSMEGRALAAEEKVDDLTAKLREAERERELHTQHAPTKPTLEAKQGGETLHADIKTMKGKNARDTQT